MEDALRDMWRSVATAAPKLLVFLLILIIGWILAKLIGKAVDKVLERVGFDRAVERGGVGRALQRSNYDASTIVSKIVYYALVLVVLQFAFGVFGPNPVSTLLSGVIAFLPKLLVALIIIVVAAAIAAAVRDIVSNALSGLSYGRMLGTVASVFILGLGVIAALNQVGIAVTVTLPVLVAVLATIGGILVVGVGGGLIKPMQERWDRYLAKAEDESHNIREHVSNRQAAEIGQPSRVVATAPSDYPTQSYQPPNAPPHGAGYPPVGYQQPQHGTEQGASYPPPRQHGQHASRQDGPYQQPQYPQQPEAGYQQGGYQQPYPHGGDQPPAGRGF
jgi:hypothetical protein